MNKQDMLIIGLGNPGQKYEDTRHNIGFLILDMLLDVWNGSLPKEKWSGKYGSLSALGCKIHLVKPLTYMNKSGVSVRQFYNFFKIVPARLLVIHDDLDMAPGRVKLVKGGGTGGHNGITSIVDQIGNKDFYRLKVGIGRPGKNDVHPEFPVEKYVLSDLTGQELDLLENRRSEIVTGVEYFIEGDSAKAMGVLNSLK